MKKRIVYCLIIMLVSFLLSNCNDYREVLVWVVPDAYAPSKSVVNAINNELNQNNYDFLVKFIEIPYDTENTYTEQVKSLLNSGEKVDIIYSGSPNSYELDEYNSSYYRFIKEGIFEPLNQFMNTNSGKSLLEAFPEKHLKAMKVNDEIYGINGSLTTLATDNILLVNQDNGNILWEHDHIYTLNEITKVMEKAIFSKDISPLKMYSQHLSYYYFKNSVEVTKCLYIDGEKVIFNLDDKEYIKYLKWLKRMMDKNIVTNGDENSNEYYASFDDCLGGYELYNSFNKNEIKKPYFIIPMESDKYIRFSNIATGISTSSTNKDKAFELLTLCFTNAKINNLLVFGEEGKDYTLENGFPINTDRSENLRIFAFGNRFICYPLYFESNEKSSEYLQAYENAQTPESLGFVFDDSSVKTQVVATNQATDEFLKILASSEITGNDVDELINKYKTIINKNGLQDIIDELNYQYTLWLSEEGV